MKVVTVVGARPQFVKAAVVSRAFRASGDVHEVLIHTGQHYDQSMSEIFFRDLTIPHPDYHLGIGSGEHGKQTGRMLSEIESVLIAERPDWVLVYGDTNSTLAGALAAAKLNIPVAHVEAGLRSFNRRMPEEINRVLTDHASSILFAPTAAAVTNLRAEGIAEYQIHEVGDVMYDAALYYTQRAKTGLLTRHGLQSGHYVLATVHRAENTDEPARLAAIVEALVRLGQIVPVILPLHPRTRAALKRDGLFERADAGMRLIEPIGYLEMIEAQMNALLIATDSGGMQKEAFFHRIPCVTLRDETEWVELVHWGWNRLCPPGDPAAMVSTLRDALGQRPAANADDNARYGGGTAGDRIVQALGAWPQIVHPCLTETSRLSPSISS